MSVMKIYSDNRLIWRGVEYPCALGKGGVLPAEDKCEGDGASPAGRWIVRRGYWRADRLACPETSIPLKSIREDDGWCDAPEDAAYNRAVRLPYPASCETLRREDELYDIIIVLSHNDDPPIPGKGSAVFFHCAKPGYPPTRGCIAVAREDMVTILKALQVGDVLELSLHPMA
ncbi:L,D-transpeptidase family protein [Woodsholea maritima]|uniref:L,D-transpeptidase family protein n=1 Tax=Woodsholea maritima TaxID=240237 RepID=UPI00036D9B3F|nr:L,D-transpeptidase family protein [Woodsholea maritima]